MRRMCCWLLTNRRASAAINSTNLQRSSRSTAWGAANMLCCPRRCGSALGEVRRMQSASIAAKRALLASPRAFLRETLGAETDDTVLEDVFRETSRYAERVIGLGLWQPRVLPWIKLATTNWFGPEGNAAGEHAAVSGPLGLIVGDRTIPLPEKEADELRERIEAAMGLQESAVTFEVDGQPVSVPASYRTLAALEQLRTARRVSDVSADPPGDSKAAVEREVLVIKPNEEKIDLEAMVGGRAAPSLGVPTSLITPPKSHQRDGLDWLQAWRAGNPGVLLADDMGLGKTLQALAFMAWLREGMTSGAIGRAPILVVAPTGLLENWCAEHDRHLSRNGPRYLCAGLSGGSLRGSDRCRRRESHPSMSRRSGRRTGCLRPMGLCATMIAISARCGSPACC